MRHLSLLTDPTDFRGLLYDFNEELDRVVRDFSGGIGPRKL